MAERRSLMVANWKMHKTVLESLAYVREWVRRIDTTLSHEQVVCPTMPALFPLSQRLSGAEILLGAQNLDIGTEGAFTGAVSGWLLREAGASYVLVGHSERRRLYGETDLIVAQKAQAAEAAHLVPIICVGESYEERQRGLTDAVITRQVTAVHSTLQTGNPVVYAYEPLWAIGTGAVSDPDEANRIAALIHDSIREIGGKFDENTRILYGGSVNPSNITAFAQAPFIDGALVGGASLTLGDWIGLNRLWGDVRL